MIALFAAISSLQRKLHWPIRGGAKKKRKKKEREVISMHVLYLHQWLISSLFFLLFSFLLSFFIFYFNECMI